MWAGLVAAASLMVDFNPLGDLVLDSQADAELIVVHHPGFADQSVYHLAIKKKGAAVQIDDTHPPARAAADASFESLLALVVDCQRAGLLPRYEPLTAARIAWAHAHGITELARRRQFGFKTRKEIVDFTSIATAALLTGIADPA